MPSRVSIDEENGTNVQNISYREFIELCRLNGFEYLMVAREKYIPIIDFFEWRSGSISIPCRSVDNGVDVILGLVQDGVVGHFYIRKMIFPEDNFLTGLRKFFIRHNIVDIKLYKR